MKIIPYFVSHAGCPHACTFCNQRVINAHSTSSLEDFEAFITKFMTTWQENQRYQLAFFGGSFTALPKDLMVGYLQRAHGLIQAGKIESLRCSTRPDCIDASILKILKEYGMVAIELGVQSFDAGVLRRTQRGHTAQDAQVASRLILDAGFELGHQLMLGLPGDPEDLGAIGAKDHGFSTLAHSVGQSIALRPHTVRLYPTQVIRHTDLAHDYLAGLYTPLSLEDALAQTMWAVAQYRRAGVQVIKVGLQANEALMDPDVRLAGPYHPAFGEWVESLLVQERLKWGLANLPMAPQTTVELLCNNRDISKAVGLSRINVAWAKEGYNLDLKVSAQGGLEPSEYILISGRTALVLPAQILPTQIL